jgi:hypothetical protein
MRGTTHLMTVAVMFWSITARAAPPASDPDWPCHERFVPEFTAATYWSGPKLPAEGVWRADPRVEIEAAALADRGMSIHDGIANLGSDAKQTNREVCKNA